MKRKHLNPSIPIKTVKGKALIKQVTQESKKTPKAKSQFGRLFRNKTLLVSQEAQEKGQTLAKAKPQKNAHHLNTIHHIEQISHPNEGGKIITPSHAQEYKRQVRRHESKHSVDKPSTKEGEWSSHYLNAYSTKFPENQKHLQ
mmetsp:Transcript_33757/g.52112  ORF Transcript_33757/g.52112 Transcript_33757/m.52112 type:complete len:143 (-) Transcript_33757:265-693(-)